MLCELGKCRRQRNHYGVAPRSVVADVTTLYTSIGLHLLRGSPLVRSRSNARAARGGCSLASSPNQHGLRSTFLQLTRMKREMCQSQNKATTTIASCPIRAQTPDIWPACRNGLNVVFTLCGSCGDHPHTTFWLQLVQTTAYRKRNWTGWLFKHTWPNPFECLTPTSARHRSPGRASPSLAGSGCCAAAAPSGPKLCELAATQATSRGHVGLFMFEQPPK